MTQNFEDIIKQKLNSETYMFQEAAWTRFQEKTMILKHRKRMKLMALSGISLVVGLLFFSYIYWSHTVQKPVYKSDISVYDNEFLKENMNVEDTTQIELQFVVSTKSSQKISNQKDSLSVLSVNKNIQSIKNKPVSPEKSSITIPQTVKKSPVKVGMTLSEEDSIMLEILNSKRYNHTIPVNSAQPQDLIQDSSHILKAKHTYNTSKKIKERY